MSSQTSIKSLTNREREVLALIGRGLSLPEIAERLFRSQKTIESHRLAIGRKLKVTNRVALVRIAIQAGLAPLEVTTASTPMDSEGQQRRNALWQTVADKARTWEALEAIDYDLSGVTRYTFLRQLVMTLSAKLTFRYAAIFRSLDNQSEEEGIWLESVSTSERGQLIDPLPALSADPHTSVLERGYYAVDTRLGKKFGYPDRLGLEAYRGIRLCTTEGEHMGVCCLLHDQPIQPDDSAFIEPEPILRLLAPRIAAELNAVRMEERLRQLSENLEQQVQRRTAELAQRETEYRHLLETMSEGLIVLDRESRIEISNQRACDILGRRSDQIVGRLITDFYTDADRESFWSNTPCRENDTQGRTRRDLVRPDGEIVSVVVSPRARYDAEGQYVGSFSVVTEVAALPSSMEPNDESE